MKICGYLLDDYGKTVFNVYSDNFAEFYIDENSEKLLNQDELEQWSIWLKSSWIKDDEIYVTEFNKSSKENEQKYRTYYQVIGYEGITAVVYGYGNTPQESLQDCMNHFEYLQKEYNKENESM